MGACAGLCYNALWYYPVLILIGGVGTIVWDVWLQQEVGKMRAKWIAKKRRARDEGGDAERLDISQSIPLEEHAQDVSTTLTQRKPHGEDSNSHALTEEVSAGQQGSIANGLPIEGVQSPEAARIEDTKTHTISVRLGISLILGFLGMLLLSRLKRF